MIWRVFYGLGFVLGPVFLWAMRWRFGDGARALELHERSVLSWYFGDALLDDVRVASVDEIRLAGEGFFAKFGVRLAHPIGLALGNLIVVRSDLSAGERASVVFHEMVHVRQHAELGAARFCGAYVGGWWRAGRVYRQIPLEREAYALQIRFERGERFRVSGDTLS